MEKKRNLWVIPTDKPSRLKKDSEYAKTVSYALSRLPLTWRFAQNIYITNDEEIKEGDWYYYFGHIVKYDSDENTLTPNCKKIILTTDIELIKDGVQEINDAFLEWFVDNPSCESVKIEDYGNLYNFRYLILIPQEEPKQSVQEYEQQGLEKYSYQFQQETLEEAKLEYIDNNVFCDGITPFEIEIADKAFIAGANYQEEKMDSYDELRRIAYNAYCLGQLDSPTEGKFNLWIQQFEKK